MEKETTNLRINATIKRRAQNAIAIGCLPGVSSLSGLTEAALDEFLNRRNVPKQVEDGKGDK